MRNPRLAPLSDGAGNTPRSVLAIEVLQENYRQDRRARYGPEGFFVRDGNDFEYRAETSMPLDPVTSLKSGELGFGERVRGGVVFVVPTTAKGFTLYFYVALPPPSTDYQTARVSLGV